MDLGSHAGARRSPSAEDPASSGLKSRRFLSLSVFERALRLSERTPRARRIYAGAMKSSEPR
jgi:hypothetical protein